MLHTAASKSIRLGVSKIYLSSHFRGTEPEQSLNACKRASEGQVTLVNIDYMNFWCVFINASNLPWSGVMAQDLDEKFPYQISEKNYKAPATFLRIEAALVHAWKKPYTVMVRVEQMPCLLAISHNVALKIDDNNHILLFDITAVVEDISQTFFGTWSCGLYFWAHIACQTFTYTDRKVFGQIFAVGGVLQLFCLLHSRFCTVHFFLW